MRPWPLAGAREGMNAASGTAARQTLITGRTLALVTFYGDGAASAALLRHPVQRRRRASRCRYPCC